jgi:Uma2 family endonuclease
MALQTQRVPYRFTQQEYLTFEREACERHEYCDGVIYAMSGESLAHGRLCQNLFRLLGNALASKACDVLGKDTKVRSGPIALQGTGGLYSYPDVLAVCGEPRFMPDHSDILENPGLIIEVLSPSTADFERGEKWERSRQWLPSLRHYLLVSQERVQVTHWYLDQDVWRAEQLEGQNATCALFALGVTLQLADIYARLPGV